MFLLLTFDTAKSVTLSADDLSHPLFRKVHVSSILKSIGITTAEANASVLLVGDSGNPSRELRMDIPDFEETLIEWAKEPSVGFMRWENCVGLHITRVGGEVAGGDARTDKIAARTKKAKDNVANPNVANPDVVSEIKELGPFMTSSVMKSTILATSNLDTLLPKVSKSAMDTMKEGDYVLLSHAQLFTLLATVMF